MKAGEEFKPLDGLCEPDPSSSMYSVLDSKHPGSVRPLTLADSYGDAEALALPESVPDAIRGYFDAARMLWVYGWFYYPFYTWAELHAAICAEMGLKHRFAAEAPPRAVQDRTFAWMIAEATKRGWLRGEGFASIRRRIDQPFRQINVLEASQPAVQLHRPIRFRTSSR